MTRETELGVLLCELFSADALRQFLRFDQRGAAVSSQLPAIPTHVGQVHRSAVALLGDAGLVDVAVLIGWFTMVSMTLAAFDVPANATGLDQ